MKILIMVLSSAHSPYDKFMKAQRETWDSIEHPNIDSIYFLHGNVGVVGNVCYTLASDDYLKMHCKMRECMEMIDISQYDFIFRTNSSSYVIKEKLFDLCKTLPKNNLYGGFDLGDLSWDKVDFKGVQVPQHCASGAGIFMSKDVAMFLRDNIPFDIDLEDDVLIGRLLYANGYNLNYINRSRVDVTTGEIRHNEIAWHYRIKSQNRQQDIYLMYKLHNKIVYGT